jgi:hypothetical protein
MAAIPEIAVNSRRIRMPFLSIAPSILTLRSVVIVTDVVVVEVKGGVAEGGCGFDGGVMVCAGLEDVCDGVFAATLMSSQKASGVVKCETVVISRIIHICDRMISLEFPNRDSKSSLISR